MAESKKTETPPQDQNLAAVIAELARALKPQGPLEQAGLTPEHIDRITKAPPPQKYRDIAWKSEETGATGVAHVVESKKFPNGRIVSIAGYTHPAEAYVFESQGGKVPDGFSIWSGQQRTIPEGQEPQQGDLNPGFLQWRYEMFYREDLRRFIGKEIKAHHCQDDGPGLKTAWAESKVGAVSEA